MTVGALVDLLRRRRTDLPRLEAKAAAAGLPKSLRSTLSSFSNDSGGTVVLGLAEESGFAPVSGFDAARARDDLASLCAGGLEPPVRAVVDVVDHEGSQLVVAEVPELERSAKPCYVIDQGLARGAYTRTGDGDRHLMQYEIQQLIANRGQPEDDIELVRDATREDLDQEAVQHLLRRVRLRQPRAFSGVPEDVALQRLAVLRRDGQGALRVTVAGLLALGIYPQTFFPQLTLTFVAIPGLRKDEVPPEGPRFLDSFTARGAVPELVESTVAAVRRNTRTASFVEGVGRRDIGEYPVEVLREVVTNAVLHRDYSPLARGSQIQVELYLDRLEVRSPGGLFGTVTVEDLGAAGISSSRNAHLAGLLEDVTLPDSDRVLVENRGSGIPDMLQRLRRAGLSLPHFLEGRTSFTVSLPKHALLTEETLAWVRRLGEPALTEHQVHALALMREGRAVSNATLRQLGLESWQATAALSDLVQRGLSEKSGGRRYAEYRLVPRLAGGPHQQERDGVAAERVTRSGRRQQVLAAIPPGTSRSAQEVADAVGLRRGMTTRYLGELVAAGELEATAPPRSRLRAYRRATGPARP